MSIPASNIVNEDTAWEGADMFDPYKDDLLYMARGHVSRDAIAPHISPGLYISEGPEHEWALPLWHTWGCWSHRTAMAATSEWAEYVAKCQSYGEQVDLFERCGCDQRDQVTPPGRHHIVWQDATQDTPGAVPVSCVRVDHGPWY